MLSNLIPCTQIATIITVQRQQHVSSFPVHSVRSQKSYAATPAFTLLNVYTNRLGLQSFSTTTFPFLRKFLSEPPPPQALSFVSYIRMYMRAQWCFYVQTYAYACV